MTARDRARLSNLVRVEQTREALSSKRTAQLETYGGDGYRVNTLGAAGAIPGRTRSTTSRGSIGEPLDILSGNLGARLSGATDQELGEALREIQRMIQVIANRRGILLYQGSDDNPNDDPNDAANDGENRAFQRFDNQLVYTGNRSTSGALYCHLPAITTEDEESPEVFVPVAMEVEINGDIPSPSVNEVYSVRARATYRMIVVSLYVQEDGSTGALLRSQGSTTVVVGSLTMQLNVAIGTIVDIGDSLTLTATATDGTRGKFTVGCRKI